MNTSKLILYSTSNGFKHTWTNFNRKIAMKVVKIVRSFSKKRKNQIYYRDRKSLDLKIIFANRNIDRIEVNK